jgi:hypothetical protein
VTGGANVFRQLAEDIDRSAFETLRTNFIYHEAHAQPPPSHGSFSWRRCSRYFTQEYGGDHITIQLTQENSYAYHWNCRKPLALPCQEYAR